MKDWLQPELIFPGVWRLTLGEPEAVTPARYKREPDVRGLEALPDAAMPPFGPENLRFTATARGFAVEIPLAAGEDVYGLGLQLKSLRQSGKKKKLRVNSDPVADAGDSHAPVPFYVSTRGYGVLADTARYATFTFGLRRRGLEPDPAAAPAADLLGGSPALTTQELYAARGGKGGSTAVIEIPAARGVALYLFGGPTILHAVQRYNLFSGGGCLPPLWGLGIWYRGCASFRAEQVLALADELRALHMPCDVFGLEPGWQSHSYSCSYVWDGGRFPHPDAMLTGLAARGLRVNLWEHVFVHESSPLYGPLREHAGDYPVWDGLVPDLLEEPAARRFAEYHAKTFVSHGISGFKLDECDNSDFIATPWSFPEHSNFPSGADGEQMHTLLGTAYQRTLLRPFEEADRRTYGEARSSGAFSAPYPYVLYSDLYDHADFIRGVAGMGFSGLLWSPEVRQCGSAEELVRRVQTAVFSPQAIINAWMIPHPPWFQYDRKKNINGLPCAEQEKLTRICRFYFELRMRLIPYLYAAFARFRFEGVPPFRALALSWPEDPACRDIDDAYLVGDALLAAPCQSGQTEREVYLPAGGWFCFWSRERYEGGRSYRVDAPLERIPLFVREDSLLPLAAPLEAVRDDTCFEITVHRFGKHPRPCVLFEDDGVSYAMERGAFNTVELTWNARGLAVKRMGHYAGPPRYHFAAAEAGASPV